MKFISKIRSDRLFTAHEDLDCALVAVADPPSGQAHLELTKHGVADAGDQAIIIQHPTGGAKQISVKDNAITRRDGDFIFYRAVGADGKKFVVNRGVRMDLIAARLADAIEHGRRT